MYTPGISISKLATLVKADHHHHHKPRHARWSLTEKGALAYSAEALCLGIYNSDGGSPEVKATACDGSAEQTWQKKVVE